MIYQIERGEKKPSLGLAAAIFPCGWQANRVSFFGA